MAILDYDKLMMPGMNDKIHDDIHKRYGVRSGLLRHEYKVYFDPEGGGDVGNEPKWDVQIQGGEVIHILLRTMLGREDYDSRLRQAFLEQRNPPLRSFLRVGTKKLSTHVVDSLSLKNAENPPAKKPKLQDSITTLVTTIRIKDRVSGRVVELSVLNSDAFTVEQMARRQLYGEAFE